MRVNIGRERQKQQNRAVLQFNKNYLISVTAMLMWAVHIVYGSKKRKLRQLFEMIVKLNRELERRYQFNSAEDEEWLYKRLLKRDLDIDIEAWYNEPKEDWGRE